MAARRALIVDDNKRLAETLAGILCDTGFEVAVVSSGVQALIAWREQPADLVILDVDLPDIRGVTLARRLLRRAAGCDVVVTSAGDPERLLPLCEEMGAIFLPKPFSRAHFAAAMQTLARKEAGRTAAAASGPRRLLGSRRPRALLQHSRPMHAGN